MVGSTHIIPPYHINRFIPPLPQRLDQFHSIAIKERLLAVERAVGEGRGEDLPQPAMLLGVDEDHEMRVFGVVGMRLGHVLGELGLVSVDVLPRLGLDERELVGRDAHYRPVFQV